MLHDAFSKEMNDYIYKFVKSKKENANKNSSKMCIERLVRESSRCNVKEYFKLMVNFCCFWFCKISIK